MYTRQTLDRTNSLRNDGCIDNGEHAFLRSPFSRYNVCLRFDGNRERLYYGYTPRLPYCILAELGLNISSENISAPLTLVILTLGRVHGQISFLVRRADHLDHSMFIIVSYIHNNLITFGF